MSPSFQIIGSALYFHLLICYNLFFSPHINSSLYILSIRHVPQLAFQCIFLSHFRL